MACGWLNWGMYDHPQAKDVSRLTGLLTVDGKEKAWGREFRELAERFRANPPVYAPPARPELPWEACTASGEAMEQIPPGLSRSLRRRMEGRGGIGCGGFAGRGLTIRYGNRR